MLAHRRLQGWNSVESNAFYEQTTTKEKSRNVACLPQLPCTLGSVDLDLRGLRANSRFEEGVTELDDAAGAAQAQSTRKCGNGDYPSSVSGFLSITHEGWL